jgi:hypothetical protein
MTTWTLAYRKRTANRFQRMVNWAGTWCQARELANAMSEAHPELEVWYVPTVGADPDAYVLTNSGRHVRIRDNGVAPAWLLARVPDAAEAQARWDAVAI